jgi:ABC-type Na+ efflux pump permease subunit
MIWHIVRKELLVNLQSLRFLIGLVVSALMMGIVGYVLVGDYAARVQKYVADVQEHRETLAQTKVYSMVAVVVDIPPSPLSVFSRG